MPAGTEPGPITQKQLMINDVQLVYVPAGCFIMGSTEEQIHDAFEMCEADRGAGNCYLERFEAESPAHEVCLSNYWISRTEITNSQYRTCVNEKICDAPDDLTYFDNSYYDDYPVVFISWEDANIYAQWLGGGLPTEAQWEYAARGPMGNIYPWGDEIVNCYLANVSTCVGYISQVGNYPDGGSWVGAQDMAGNVWEWVFDWYSRDYYSTFDYKEFDPRGPDTGSFRIRRGGAFLYVKSLARSAYRFAYGPPGTSEGNLGFRIIVSDSLP